MKKALEKIEKPDAKIIPIVLCTDHSYHKYALVALQSIIENRSLEKNVFYKIFIFHDDQLPENDIQKFESLQFENLSVECKNVEKFIDRKSLYTRAHYSIQMFYRWLIAEVLLEYDKAIYLDCDLVTSVDLQKLYEIDLGDNIVGAVVDNVNKDRVHFYIEKELHLRKESYINSGVLLIDIKKFKEEKIKERCIEVLKKHSVLSCPDQDAINIVLKDKIFLLDGCWNVQWGNLEEVNDKLKINILHFTTDVKPWKSNGANLQLADLFWKYAKDTVVYQDLLEFSKISKKKTKKQKKLRKNRFMRFISLPFRILRKFFLGWKDVGLKNSLHEIWYEIKYLFYRYFGKK